MTLHLASEDLDGSSACGLGQYRDTVPDISIDIDAVDCPKCIQKYHNAHGASTRTGKIVALKKVRTALQIRLDNFQPVKKKELEDLLNLIDEL